VHLYIACDSVTLEFKSDFSMLRCFAQMHASWLYIARTDMASMDNPWVWTCIFACITIFDDLMSEKKLTKIMESLHNAFRMKYDTVE